MSIQSNGAFNFSRETSDLLSNGYYQKLIKKYETACAIQDVEGLVVDGAGNIAIIYKTKKFTLPKFNEIGDELGKASKRLQISKCDFLSYLQQIETRNSAVETFVKQIVDSDLLMFSREQILKIITDKSVRKQLSDIIERETGFPLKIYLRGGEKKASLFGSNIHLNFYKEGDRISYYVGEKNDGIKQCFPRASLIRELEGNIEPEKILKLLMVDFVRNEQLTVIPFPFKYIREFALMHGGNEEYEEYK